MKKLLILILTLALTSAANATFSFVLYESDQTTVADAQALSTDTVYVLMMGLTNPETPMDGATNISGPDPLVYDYSLAELTYPQTIPPGYNEWDPINMMMLWGINDPGQGGIPDPMWWSWDIVTDSSAGTFNVNFFDWAAATTTVPFHTWNMQIIPEPGTIALLGLGGLVVIRKLRK